uniref:BESS domain-containing protein n=1 Tax=Steinernema glaseri TaxID=37863 RepID=A0A1I7Z6Y3_9BILA
MSFEASRVKREPSVEFCNSYADTSKADSIYEFVEEQLAHLPEPLRQKAQRKILLVLSKEVEKIEAEHREESSSGANRETS